MNSAVWFKIAEDGKHDDGSWASVRFPKLLFPLKYKLTHSVGSLYSGRQYIRRDTSPT